MIRWLTGVTNDAVAAIARAEGLGLMAQPRSAVTRHIPLYPVWAADNGCFSAGPRFDLGRFYTWLEEQIPLQDTCLFAVAPDVYGDSARTELRSAPVVPEIRARGYRAAYVAQNGLTPDTCPWPLVDVLFLGGSGRWKLSHHALALTQRAQELGKPVHMGRVNGYGRLVAAALMGCATADGSHLKHSPDVTLMEVVGWLHKLRLHQPLRTGHFWATGVGV